MNKWLLSKRISSEEAGCPAVCSRICNCKPQEIPSKDNMPGNGCFWGFLHRYPELSTCTSESVCNLIDSHSGWDRYYEKVKMNYLLLSIFKLVGASQHNTFFFFNYRLQYVSYVLEE